MPGNPWNDATNCRLFLAIIHLTSPKLPNWNEVALMMDEGFTAESTRQHFQKMRKESKAKFGELGEGGTPRGTPAKGTPRKPKGSANNSAKTTPSKAGAKRKAVDDDDDEDGDTENRPFKKQEVKMEHAASFDDFDFEKNEY